MTDDDRELVADFLATRSEQAFRRLYRRHASAVYALLLRLTAGDAARAEDCLQDAWLRAIAGLERFAWRSSLRTWIRGIAINCWREGCAKTDAHRSTWSRRTNRKFPRRPLSPLDVDRARARGRPPARRIPGRAGAA